MFRNMSPHRSVFQYGNSLSPFIERRAPRQSCMSNMQALQCLVNAVLWLVLRDLCFCLGVSVSLHSPASVRSRSHCGWDLSSLVKSSSSLAPSSNSRKKHKRSLIEDWLLKHITSYFTSFSLMIWLEKLSKKQCNEYGYFSGALCSLTVSKKKVKQPSKKSIEQSSLCHYE